MMSPWNQEAPHLGGPGRCHGRIPPRFGRPEYPIMVGLQLPPDAARNPRQLCEQFAKLELMTPAEAAAGAARNEIQGAQAFADNDGLQTLAALSALRVGHHGGKIPGQVDNSLGQQQNAQQNSDKAMVDEQKELYGLMNNNARAVKTNDVELKERK